MKKKARSKQGNAMATRKRPERSDGGLNTQRVRRRTTRGGVDPDALEYQVNIAFDSRDGIYVARVPELENCHTHGDTPEKALANARAAIELWVDTARRRGKPVPEPISRRKFSGRFVLRTSEALHARLAHVALNKGQSMNDLVVEILEQKIRDAG
ncbi:MAG: hypothetical protein RIQ81_165 [Pseudomonadota bacterium]